MTSQNEQINSQYHGVVKILCLELLQCIQESKSHDLASFWDQSNRVQCIFHRDDSRKLFVNSSNRHLGGIDSEIMD